MTARRDRVVFYRDADKQWRWRYVSANGRILADGGQGYSRRIDAEKGVARVTHCCQDRRPDVEVKRS